MTTQGTPREETESERTLRETVMTTDEKTRYDSLVAAAQQLPSEHRAALPAYLLLLVWAAACLGLTWFMINGQDVSTRSQTGGLIVLLLLVMFGGFIAICVFLGKLLRRSKAAHAQHHEAAMHAYLNEIGYEERASKEQMRQHRANQDFEDARRESYRHPRRDWRSY